MPAADEWLAGRLAALPSAVWNRPKNNHVSGPFFDFGRRHCLEIESLAPPAARCGSDGDKNSIPQKDESPSEGPKNRLQGQKTACASNGIKDGRRRIDFIGGRFRRKSAKIRMRIRMHFAFSRAEEASMPTGSKAKACSSLQPYAVLCTVCSSLKRKRAEKGPTPKRGA